jgi:plastin-1
MSTVRERMAQFERPSLGGEAALPSRRESTAPDIARRISILAESGRPSARGQVPSSVAAAAEAETPPAHGAPPHPRGVFVPLRVMTPESAHASHANWPDGAAPSPRAAAAAKPSATPTRSLWRISSGTSPKTPSHQAQPLASAAASFAQRAAFRSCEMDCTDADGATIPVRELAFGLGLLARRALRAGEAQLALEGAGLGDATRLSLADFARCAAQLDAHAGGAGATLKRAVAITGVVAALRPRAGAGAARGDGAARADENADPATAGGGAGVAAGAAKPPQLLRVHGAHASSVHSFAEEEKAAFSVYLSRALAGDADLAAHLPIDPASLELFSKVADGVLLCKLVAHAAPDELDVRAINTARRLAAGRALSRYQIGENHALALAAASAAGVRVVNIDATDLLAGTPHLVLGLVWQLVRLALLARVDLAHHPGLAVLLAPGEGSLDALRELPAEALLLRWLNWHLEQAGRAERVRNFGRDLADSVAYAVVLARIAPPSAGGGSLAPLALPDLRARAEAVVAITARLGERVQFAISAADICAGNEKLGLGFVAALFNAAPALEDQGSAEARGRLAALAAAAEAAAAAAAAAAPIVSAAERERALDESREERAFRMWMNSLGLDKFVRSLFDDCRDGLALLQTMDTLRPGAVDWQRVDRRARSVYESVANANYAVELGAAPIAPRAGAGAGAATFRPRALSFGGRASLGGAGAYGVAPPPTHGFGLSLVGICGKDVLDGNRTYILAIVWQLMRFHLLNFLSLAFEAVRRQQALRDAHAGGGDDDAARGAAGLMSPSRAAVESAARAAAAAARGGAPAPLTEEDVLRWANDAVARAGSRRRADSFRDKSLATGRFLLDLLAAVEPRAVDATLIAPVEFDLIRGPKWAAAAAAKASAGGSRPQPTRPNPAATARPDGAADDAARGAPADGCALNAKYAISCARKMGCSVFCLWEDVVEVRPKLLFTFVAAVMARELQQQRPPSVPAR